MTRQVVVIGGDAAGASAASAVKRALKRDVRVTVLERQRWTSYSACGIPYWMAGQVDGPDRLVVRGPEEHRSRGLVVRTRVEATAIDPAGQTVTARDLSTGEDQSYEYDDLIIATGAIPVRPPIPGIDLPGVHGIQLLSDGLDMLESLHHGPKRAVVVGAGYIGIEMAEAMQNRGLEVTIVDLAEQPMRSLDPDMGELIAAEMEGMGITYRGGEPVQAIEAASDGRVASVLCESTSIPADIVVLGLGVRPNSRLARMAGLPIGEHDAGAARDREYADVAASRQPAQLPELGEIDDGLDVVDRDQARLAKGCAVECGAASHVGGVRLRSFGASASVMVRNPSRTKPTIWLGTGHG